MLLGMQDFDFAQILSDYLKYFGLYFVITKVLGKFTLILSNFSKICLNFTQICPKKIC